MENLEIIEKVERMLNDGMTYSEVAGEIGQNGKVGASFVSSLVKLEIVHVDNYRKRMISERRIRKLKEAIHRRIESIITKEELENLLKAQKSIREISQLYDVSVGFITRRISEWDLSLRFRYDNFLDYLQNARKIDVNKEEIEEYFSQCKRDRVETLKLRYDEHLSFRDIAKMYGLSAERIRQIIAKEERVLEYYFVRKRNAEKYKEQVEIENKRKEEERRKNLENGYVLIDDLELSTRGYNCLKRRGLQYLPCEEVHTYSQLREIRNLGKTTEAEIIDALRQFGIELQKNVK